jgi:hypothetical protein
MNERLKELAELAGVTFNRLGASYAYGSLPELLERFAELIRADEREDCAKLCDDWLVGRDDICEVAKAIRARGKE